MTFNSKTFLTRTASAAVFVVLLLGCVWFHPLSFIAFFTAVALVGIYEFYKLSAFLGGNSSQSILSYFLLILSTAALFFAHYLDLHFVKPYILLLILAGPLYLIIQLFKSEPRVFKVSAGVLSFFYIILPCLLLTILSKSDKALIGTGEFAPQKVLGMIFFIWINDTGAYLVGSFLGKHKMYERISPGKTWEGTVGGVLLCMGASFLMVRIFPQLELQHWMAVSAIVAVFGTIGDLVESMFKRLAGVKDSGSIMPGHGGVLDRFDSLIFATPFVFAYLAATGNL